LGQNFAKAFDVKFATRDGGQELVWATSWGVSTRLMGALIMTHSDDAGLVLPPKLAPIEVVLVPIYKGEEQMAEIVAALQGVADALEGSGHSGETGRRRFQAFGLEVRGIRIEGRSGAIGHGTS
jgi:prolyl-tRNA synthetase